MTILEQKPNPALEGPMRICGISSERIDVRREKKYGLIFSVRLRLGDLSYCTACVGRGAPKLHELAKGLPHYNGGWRSGTDTLFAYCYTCKSEASFVVAVNNQFYIKADRPSEIPSESQAQALIAREAKENAERGRSNQPPRLDLEQILIERVNARFTEFFQLGLRHDIAKQANTLIGYLVDMADEQAREAISFNQKVEALKAELLTAQQRQLITLVAELPATDRSRAQIQDESHPVALKLAMENCAKHLPPAFAGLFDTIKPTFIKVDDVPEDVKE